MALSGETTVQQVLDLTRTRLNDWDVAGGTYANYAFLQAGPFPLAYAELVAALELVGASQIKREFYATLPPFTNRLIPLQYGIVDFDEPELIWERGNLALFNITAITGGTPIQVTTSAPHGLIPSQEVIISGVTETLTPWGIWYPTIIDALNFTLNGSIGDGTNGASGTASYTSDEWAPVVSVDTLDQNQQAADRLSQYEWSDNAILFLGATSQRQLRIKYWSDGTAPVNLGDTIPWDKAATLLSAMVALQLANSKGWDAKAASLRDECFGPSMQPDGSGGLLHQFLGAIVRNLSRTSRSRMTFRPARTRRGTGSLF